MKEEKETKQLVLMIKKPWLEKIVSGEKKEEYRESKAYYYQMFLKKFGGFDEGYWVLEPPKTLLLRCGYLKTKNHVVKEDNGVLYESPLDQSKPYCIIEVEKIRHEEFIEFIPDGFQQHDRAYTIYIKRVLEHNLPDPKADNLPDK